MTATQSVRPSASHWLTRAMASGIGRVCVGCMLVMIAAAGALDRHVGTARCLASWNAHRVWSGRLFDRGGSVRVEPHDDDLSRFEAEGAAPLPAADDEGSIEREGARIWYASYGAGPAVILRHV